MKYKTVKSELFGVVSTSVITTNDEVAFTSFNAVIGNPNYDQFLVQVGLTDAEVHELEPDVWYDFPQKEENNG